MCSQNVDEVEAVRKTLLRAGIAAETRTHPVAEELGMKGVELWVQDERDFFNAAKLFERMQDGSAGKISERSVGVAKAAAERCSTAHRAAKSVDSRHASEPGHEELQQAKSLLEKGIADMFARESELTEECASLRNKVQELSQALSKGQAALRRESEGRAAAEKNLQAQVSGLVSTLERERLDWQKQLKSRDDALKNAQKGLEAMCQRLQVQQAATTALKEQVVSLEMQRDERETSLCSARAEALAEREARIAADEQAKTTSRAQQLLKKQLVEQKEREYQMQTYLAGLNSLLGKSAVKAVASGSPR
jgi:hypothetical protein